MTDLSTPSILDMEWDDSWERLASSPVNMHMSTSQSHLADHNQNVDAMWTQNSDAAAFEILDTEGSITAWLQSVSMDSDPPVTRPQQAVGNPYDTATAQPR